MDLAERMEDMLDFPKDPTTAVTEYTEPLLWKLTEKMIVQFMCGLDVEVSE